VRWEIERRGSSTVGHSPGRHGPARVLAMAYAKAIADRAGILETISRKNRPDLFGEQRWLCGGLSEL